MKQLLDDKISGKGYLTYCKIRKSVKNGSQSAGIFNSVADNEVDEIVVNYTNTNQLQEHHFKNINTEAKLREITKQGHFRELKLRINLPKFSGYDLKLHLNSFHEDMKIYDI